MVASGEGWLKRCNGRNKAQVLDCTCRGGELFRHNARRRSRTGRTEEIEKVAKLLKGTAKG
jgi:hypothetical protein